jgi:phosphinothricin acetyltransferase
MAAGDWPAVRAIYEAGIGTRNATFETEAPTWERWDGGHLPGQRLVAVDRTGVIGWAALSPVSSRYVYRGVTENSVYIAPEARGRGVGRLVLGALIESAESADIWTIQTGIFPENAASLALHAACGFRVVGIRERVGQLDGHWRDVAVLERRSSVVGVDKPALRQPAESGSADRRA